MNSFRESMAVVKLAIANDMHDEAFRILGQMVSPEDDFVSLARIAKVFSSLELAELNLRPIKIALLASSTVDHFASILRFWLAREGWQAEIWIAPYDTIATTILDPDSDLYRFHPDLVWIFTSHRDVRLDISVRSGDEVASAVKVAIHAQKILWETLQSRLSCMVLQNNADIPSVDPFGNFSGQVPWSNRNVLRSYNLELGISATPGIVVFDLDHFASCYGRAQWTDQRYWYHSKHAFSFNVSGLLAFQAAKLISGLKGLAKKCLVLDLDNTLWGGVIGDDGVAGIRLGNGADGEAFVDFQRYILALKNRGIILAVCSKNEEETAKEPFTMHSDMILGLEDIAVFRANWQNKADNIREIARTLKIGLDSLVFVDDNPVERNLVREFLPMVAVPDLPSDPSLYIAAIERHHYFETGNFSPEDRDRASYYRSNAMRIELMERFADVGQYLASLEMVSEVGDLDEFHLPRMAQLINKSNQFHLTGTRYPDGELSALATRSNCFVRYYRLTDKFGDNGLIAVVVLDGSTGTALFIDTWVMSCRVLGRTMEEFIISDIACVAHLNGFKRVTGRYVPSAKNKLVRDLYQRLRFSMTSEEVGTTNWCYDLEQLGESWETKVKALS